MDSVRQALWGEIDGSLVVPKASFAAKHDSLVVQ